MHLEFSRHLSIECRLVVDRFVRHLLLNVFSVQVIERLFLARSRVAAFQRQRSSAEGANVAVFVIDARRSEERLSFAVNCIATWSWLGSDKRVP